MTKVVAKREACFLASLVLKGLNDGGDWGALEVFSPADRERVMDGIRELVQELGDRGWKAGP